MSKNFESTLDFVITSSRIYRAVLVALHVLAFSACWLNTTPVLVQIILAACVAISWYRNDKAEKAKWIYLRYTGKQGWKISLNGKDFLAIAIKPTSVITETMTFLHYTNPVGAKTGTLLVVRDAMPGGEYRKMVVTLKLLAYGMDR